MHLTHDTLNGAENDIVHSLAGIIAETRYDPSYGHLAIAEQCASRDFQKIQALAAAVSFSQKPIDELRQRCEELIDQNWHQVEVLAQLVLSEKCIDGEAAEFACDIADGDDLGALMLREYPFLARIQPRSAAKSSN